MNLPRVSSVCLWALTTVAAAGSDQARPLEESTKELKKLEAGPAAAGVPTARESLKGMVMPSLETPAASAPRFQRFTPQQAERERQQRNDAQKNWLLNGMNKLQRESEEKGLLPGGADPESGVEDLPVDTTDPAYLLRLYEKQRKAGETRAGEAKALRAPQADPFAPFLQGWLAGSPLKHHLLSESLRPKGGDGNPGMLPGSSTNLPGGTAAGMVISNGAAAASAPGSGNPNPYLATPEASPLGGTIGMHRPAAPASMPTPTATPPPVSPIGSGIARETAPAANDRKPPPPPLADEKKYFPQLKKF